MIDYAKWQKKKGKGGKKINVDPKDICNYYKELGHWKRDCLEKVKKYFVDTLVQNKSSSENNLVLTVGEPLQQHSKQWVLDSGCSYHMCPHRNWFVTYEKSGGNILMDNDAPCKSVNIGSIEIRMHDGVVRILTYVCHVSELKRNLVSVGAMVQKVFLIGLNVELCRSKGKRSLC